jgi:hypothetical protein
MTAQTRRAPILPSDHPVTRDSDETSWSPVTLALAVLAGLAVIVAVVFTGSAGVAFLDALGRLFR